MAEGARNQVDAAGLGGRSPRLVWDVSDSLATTVAACPDGSTDKTAADCLLQYADSLTLMAYRSFAVQAQGKHQWCDGIVPHAAQLLVKAQQATKAASKNKSVVIGVETVCDVSYDPVVDGKISFCSRYHGSVPGEADAASYLWDSLKNVTAFLKNTDYARSDYPCLAQQADLPMPAGADLWTATPVGASVDGTAATSESPSFAIHSFAGLSRLAYNADIFAVCPNTVPQPHDACL
jgi:hypothetical protein